MKTKFALATSASVLLLSVAACGSDDDTAASSAAPVTSAASQAADKAMDKADDMASGATDAADKGADKVDDMKDKADDMADKATGKSTGYVSYDDYKSKMTMYQGSPTVLFFHASWCPSCKKADAALNETAPTKATVVKVDFDNSKELREKYGITQQHTFVQIDKEGNEIAKWSGSNSASDIEGKLKA